MHVKSLGAAIFWTAAVALAVMRTTDHAQALAAWVVITAAIAAVLTLWITFEAVVRRAEKKVVKKVAESHDRSVRKVANQIADAMEDDHGSGPRPLR